MPYVVLAARALLIGVFAASVAGKLRSRGTLVADVAAFRILPEPLALSAAVLAVAAEAIAVVALAVPATLRIGFGLSGLLLAGFTAVIAQAMLRKLHVPCPCFGASAAPVGLRHLLRNVVLAAAAVVGLLGGGSGHVESGGAVVAVAAGALAVLLVRFLDDIAALFAYP